MSVSPVFSCLVLFGGFVGRYACGLHEQIPSTASRPVFDVAVASISAPGVHLGDDAEALDLARRCNDCLAEMVRDRPDRFCGFAILPLPDVDAALGELTRALDVLRLDGVVLMTNALGHYLGEPLYRPLFDELQRRGAVVFLHPTMSPDPSAHRLGLNDSLLDFPVDTARTVAQMHCKGVFAATRDVKYAVSHTGGVVPYLARRFAVIDEMAVLPDEDGTRGSAADTFRRLYWDTALSWSDTTLHTLRAVAGIDHVVYGSDYPYLRRDIAIRGRGELENSAELSEVERDAVLHATAVTLLPRLASSPAPARRGRGRTVGPHDDTGGQDRFISGASRGIGLAIAKRIAADGANIALMAKTAEPHPKLPGTVHGGQGDRRGRP